MIPLYWWMLVGHRRKFWLIWVLRAGRFEDPVLIPYNDFQTKKYSIRPSLVNSGTSSKWHWKFIEITYFANESWIVQVDWETRTQLPSGILESKSLHFLFVFHVSLLLKAFWLWLYFNGWLWLVRTMKSFCSFNSRIIDPIYSIVLFKSSVFQQSGISGIQWGRQEQYYSTGYGSPNCIFPVL